MPRLSIRKIFIYFLGASSCLLLVLNIHQRTIGLFLAPLSGPSGLRGPTGAASQAGLQKDPTEDQTTAFIQSQHPAEAEPDAGINHGNCKYPDGRKKAMDLSDLDPSDKVIPPPEQRAWYMKGGELLPKRLTETDPSTGHRIAQVWPEELPGHDRIPEQLMFLPDTVPKDLDRSDIPLKKILLWNGISSWGGIRPGRGEFLRQGCPVSSCVISSSRSDQTTADLILFKDHFTQPGFKRPMHQAWMMYLLECPLHTQMFKQKDVFNWTATYRSDSTVVAPYERWQYFNPNVYTQPQEKNYAANKTKAVAWFVSNCGARNGRLNYAKELQKFIEVDIYGSCGTKRCPRSQQESCFKMLNTDYKFYLAFENSNCQDYITEKFFVNGLGHDVIPIVMGARPQDYERSSPYKSFIHVDDFEGPKELAEYLHKLDKDDKLYNEYFQWKGTGQFINTKFFCRVCSLLHDPKAMERADEHKWFHDINEWWRGKGTCINGSWRKFQKAMAKQKSKEIDTEKEKADSQGRA